MKFTIFQNPNTYKDELQNKAKEICIKEGFIYDNENPDIIFFLGGDGTFLRAVQKYINILDKVQFIGVNKGTLGYFYDNSLKDVKEAINLIKSNEYITKYLTMIKAVAECSDGHNEEIYAVNEVRIENPFHTLITNVYIDDEFLETYRGTGLLVASAIGSSAYNRSSGGAIVDPQINAMELTEIASIQNNSFRSLSSSLVVPSNSVIKFDGDLNYSVIGFDYDIKEIKNPKVLKITTSDKKIKLLYTKNHSFISTLIRSFIR